MAPTLTGGVPHGVIFYYSKNNEQVKDKALLDRLASTDSSLQSLDFSVILTEEVIINPITIDEGFVDVVEVQTGEEWSDYRPARPQDFVGRAKDQKYIFDFFKKVVQKETKTRVFALTGNSGMGKSSLVAKLAHRANNKFNRKKLFILPVDVRAATSPSYVFSAVLTCLKLAQSRGLGDSSISLVLSDVTNPLNSPSIKSFLQSVESNDQLITLIFDQFEELYSKPELYDVFSKAKSILLNTAAVRTNFCVGFAWKSDSTTHSEHPAYFFWHQLSDYRIERKLVPFSDGESSAAINVFEKELGQKLHNDLKHNLIVSSQGYPWLLKKLCIHIFEQISQGNNQQDLLDNKLDVASLFDSDLAQLSPGESTCLNFVADRAPVDWFEVIDLSGSEVLNSLINRRLIVRSGDRLNVYWDIFREYVRTGKVPNIPLRYLPSTDFSSLLKVATHLNHEASLTVSNLVSITKLSEGTIQNIGSDLYMFEIADREDGAYSLHKGLPNNGDLDFLRAIREKFRKHAFTLELKDRGSSSVITKPEAIEILKGIYLNSTYAQKTWNTYSSRLLRWLELCGLVVSSRNGWLYRDHGDVVAERTKSIRHRRRSIFTAPASPALSEEAFDWLINQEKVLKQGRKPPGYRNALTVLTRFDLALQDHQYFFPNSEKRNLAKSCAEAIWVEAKSEPILREVAEVLSARPSSTAREIGGYLSQKYFLNWTDASQVRNGGAIRQWAGWLLEDKDADIIPKLPGRL